MKTRQEVQIKHMEEVSTKGWNDFSQEKPLQDGFYMVYIDSKHIDPFIDIYKWSEDKSDWTIGPIPDCTYWRELPAYPLGPAATYWRELPAYPLGPAKAADPTELDYMHEEDEWLCHKIKRIEEFMKGDKWPRISSDIQDMAMAQLLSMQSYYKILMIRELNASTPVASIEKEPVYK